MKLFRLLLTAILCFSAISLSADEKRVALVIGNADYRYGCGVAPLTNPVNDATAIASKLKSLGFTISGNGAQVNMTREQMRQAIKQFRYDSRDADVAIFYYSGHGASRDNKETLLLPVGEKFELVGFREQCIDISMVIEALHESKSKAKIVFLDACRNSPFNDGTKAVNDINKGLFRIDPPKGLIICYATEAGETATEGIGKYSPYTDALLKQLDVKNMRFGAFLTAVKNRVDIATNHHQIPSTSGHLEGDFYFNEDVSENPHSTKYEREKDVDTIVSEVCNTTESSGESVSPVVPVIQTTLPYAQSLIAMNYLHFVAAGDNSSVTLLKVGDPHPVRLEISLDGKNWEDYTFGNKIILKNRGDLVYFRNKFSGSHAFSKEHDHYMFNLTGEVEGRGNIMSLIDASLKNTSVPEYAFQYLFSDCSSLTSSPELPATNLGKYSYFCMFRGCTNLATAPRLPAIKLANYCYMAMFTGCTALTTAPQLPAIKLANMCYCQMFDGCTNLTAAPKLPATELAESCYGGMFAGCTSLTTAPALPAMKLAKSCCASMYEYCTSLTCAPALPATRLAESCYGDMFSGCTSLTTAPALPATVLAERCYDGMFSGCASLTTAPALPATVLAESCYASMFKGCTRLTTAPALPATILAFNCYNSMFELCKSLTTAPALPAKKLTYGCYSYMFNTCPQLNYIKMLATDVSAPWCLEYWVGKVSASGTFIKAENATWDMRGDKGVPSGWKIITE